jgi:hypothetical protein
MELVRELVTELLMFSRCELFLLEAVAKARDSFGTHKKGNFYRWKPLPSNGSKDVTVDTSLYV